MKSVGRPTAIIDSLKYLRNNSTIHCQDINPDDYEAVIKFLTAYDGNTATFESYRRELERLLQWCCLIAKKSILKLTREDIEAYIQFCLKPPSTWIGRKQVARFIDNNEGLRIPNPEWHPFIVKVSKQDSKLGKIAKKSDYQMSQSGIRALFAVLGSFYDHLLLEEEVDRNPIALIRQKNRYLQKQQQKQIIRLSEKQWQSCLNVAREMADENPNHHERTLFIITAMYLMYLRISEFVSTPRWTPMMNHFYRDSNEQWWFKVVGKGNKLRIIAVSDTMLSALSRHREALGLSPLPSPSENTPLIPKSKGKGPIESTRQIRRLIQSCFDKAILKLQEKNQYDEANTLETATAHWLRHTGISDDVNKRGRPIMHVREDAGHTSIVTTEGYSDVETKDRHHSAKDKTTCVEDEIRHK